MERRNPKIDALRGVAVLFVVLLHVNLRVPFSETFIGGEIPNMLYKILFWSGYYGVCIFFVVSGFLITNSSLNRWGSVSEVRPLRFYWLRAARILPLLFVLLVVLSVLDLMAVEGFVINPEQASLTRAVVAALTFQINWLEMNVGYLPASWDILWSLSVEEMFYLIFPLICLITKKDKYFIAFMTIFVVAAPFFRTVFFTEYELGDKNNFAYMDGIAIGCIAALVSYRKAINPKLKTVMTIAGWMLLGAVLVFRSAIYKAGISGLGLNVTMLSIGVALLLIAWSQQQPHQRRGVKWLSGLCFWGRNSYEVYLTHMFVVIGIVWLYDTLGLGAEWVWGVYISIIVLSGVLGELVARYYSNPMNARLRSKQNKKTNN